MVPREMGGQVERWVANFGSAPIIYGISLHSTANISFKKSINWATLQGLFFMSLLKRLCHEMINLFEGPNSQSIMYMRRWFL
jgi:hypothetical protein